jgi:hypothetical protein
MVMKTMNIMKKMMRIWLLLMAVAMVGCQSVGHEPSADLVVMEQTDTVRGGTEDNDYEWVAFTVDVPVNGPKALLDSVMAFVNTELHAACECVIHFDESCVTFSSDDVFTDDGERLLSHYMKKYKSQLQDSLGSVFALTMKMEAQTAKYVTYGLETFHCGASCGSEKFFYTFDKNDGHQVKEIISRDNLVRFFNDYPEYNSVADDPWFGRAGWQFFPEDDADRYDFGLLDDHFSLAIQGCGNHYLLLDFPYGQTFSYLSPEAQDLVKQDEENEPMLPAYLSYKHPEVNLEVDTVNYALIGCVNAAGGERRDTLMHYDPALEIYPKLVYSIDASIGSPLYLLTYSFGHLLYRDEAMTCIYNDDYHLQPVSLFSVDGQRDSVVCCLWYDQLVEASDGFPFDEFDENRFGLHYDPFTKRLYSPILADHDPNSEFANTFCLQYTGRFEVLQFNGKEFVLADDDGAWWLNPDLRNYKRTVSNRKTEDGIEQIDLMPDGTYRRAVWKGAKTLDDLRRKPDEVKVGSQQVFKD